MNIKYTSWIIALKIWAGTNLLVGLSAFAIALIGKFDMPWVALPIMIAGSVLSAPLVLILKILISWFQTFGVDRNTKTTWLAISCLAFSLLYGVVVAAGYTGLNGTDDFITAVGVIVSVLALCSLISIVMCRTSIHSYFTDTSLHHSQSHHSSQIHHHSQTNIMETTNTPEPGSNRILFKGSITAVLILLMLVPMAFISNLINEREARQREVVAEVSGKWAAEQTYSGPFLYVPYRHTAVDAEGKNIESTRYFWILPENLKVSGTVSHEIRERSIYKVLLYRADLHNEGDFIIGTPGDVEPGMILWQDIRICYGISDFKGIEEKIMVRVNGVATELSPGLPAHDLAVAGLSAPLALQSEDIGKSIAFESAAKIKGSSRLQFLPLSGNSEFDISAAWPSPSFDGNNLPSVRTVSDSGFAAKWIFNKANLPFGTVLQKASFDVNSLAFGVTLLQPADQYAKTQRTVKYAILIIGLTFALFFIVELMQRKPVHPVQYLLIGMALVIFYTLLLSISEFLRFDTAYLIAVLATLSLVTLYAKSHFGNWRSAGVLGGILASLYGFIFVLIRLEDTALLVGSIGLFVILAIAMYASRKVNWYGR